MKKATLLLALFVLPGALAAQAPAADSGKKAAATSVSVGLAAENNEIVKPETSFALDGDTKVYAGAKVAAAGDWTLAFRKGDTVAYEKKISAPSAPYRIWTWKTFRKGDVGDWTAVLTGPGGETATADFKVAFK